MAGHALMLSASSQARPGILQVQRALRVPGATFTGKARCRQGATVASLSLVAGKLRRHAASRAHPGRPLDKFQVGEHVEGMVVQIYCPGGVSVDVGCSDTYAFLEVEEFTDGFPRKGPFKYKPGDQISARILSVNPEARAADHGEPDPHGEHGDTGRLYLTLRSGADLARPDRYVADSSRPADVRAFRDTEQGEWLTGEVVMMSSWAVYVKVTSPAGKPFVGILAEEDFDGEFVQDVARGSQVSVRIKEVDITNRRLLLTMRPPGDKRTFVLPKAPRFPGWGSRLSTPGPWVKLIDFGAAQKLKHPQQTMDRLPGNLAAVSPERAAKLPYRYLEEAIESPANPLGTFLARLPVPACSLALEPPKLLELTAEGLDSRLGARKLLWAPPLCRVESQQTFTRLTLLVWHLLSNWRPWSRAARLQTLPGRFWNQNDAVPIPPHHVASREVVQHDLSTTTTTSTRCCTCRDSPRKPDNGTISTLHCPRFCKRLLVPFSS
ncbi:hypothetical protein AK812_SmicGene28085 [Symbiodinium microadriaticum]|uniref:S1 motif domain-containing protein n=1 Tax=Symbiodinium microadriaticum TaxID=2951 RepID=A0A1Q9D581_SYMMI|nr:hypothetical protein AK812_SmicGene28085 [Symbiodinium microadriaticum]